MSDYESIELEPFPVNDDGHHPCGNCGHVWFETRVVFDADASPAATSLDATCAECGFPLMIREVDRLD